MEFACAGRFNNYVLSSCRVRSRNSKRRISFFFLFISFFFVFVGEPGASSFGRCRDASLPCVDRRVSAGTGTSGTGFSTKKKKIIDDALQIRVRSTGARREKRRKLQAPKARGEVGWRRRCRVACGLERKKKEAAKVWAMYFFFTPSPHRHGKASGQSARVQKPSPQRHANSLANPWAWDGMAIGARASLANHRVSLSKP
ncbi:hypothetical protein GGI35DRAFT_132161 [Trichoderma velutinum]